MENKKTTAKPAIQGPDLKCTESTGPKRKLPFWIKKKYLQNNKDIGTEGEPKTKKKRSIFRNSPFRDPDRGMIS